MPTASADSPGSRRPRPPRKPGSRAEAHRAGRAGVRRPRARASRWPAASATQHRGAIELCAAVNLLNYVAGNVGKTVKFGADLRPRRRLRGAAPAGRRRWTAGRSALLLVHDANPVYALPKAAGFADKLKKVAVQGLDVDVPRRDRSQCDLLLPNHHALERWDDLRAACRRPRPDAAGHGAGVRRRHGDMRRRRAAQDGAESGRRVRPVHRADLRGAPQDALAGLAAERRAATAA